MRTVSFVIVAATVMGCSGHRFESFFSSGDRYLSARRYSEAAIEFQNAARINPDSAAVQARLGDVYAAMNQTMAAATAYQRACALNPNDPKKFGPLGSFMADSGFWNEGVSLPQKGIALIAPSRWWWETA